MNKAKPSLALLLTITLCVQAAQAAVELPVLFDLGTDTSPVAQSAVRVSHSNQYQPGRGFGWTSTTQSSFDRAQPLRALRHGGNPMRPDLLYHSHATPLNRDGVASKHDLTFRIDVPPGTYRVHAWLGDLHASLESLAVECNGITRATGISAKHMIGRSKLCHRDRRSFSRFLRPNRVAVRHRSRISP